MFVIINFKYIFYNKTTWFLQVFIHFHLYFMILKFMFFNFLNTRYSKLTQINLHIILWQFHKTLLSPLGGIIPI